MSADLPPMEYRFLGRSGLQVSAISLGGWVTYGGQVGNEIAFDCMKAAYDAGVNFFDCAETYANGESEKVMGEAIKRFGWKRADIVISTKIYWGKMLGDNVINKTGLSRKHIVEGTNAALERLQLDYVDLIYAHRPDRKTPMEEIVRAFNHIIDTGKAFYWGTSEWEADEIVSAHVVAQRLGLQGPTMEQPQYNMLVRDKVEKSFSLIYANYGLGITSWSPMKMGILTGKYNDEIPSGSRLGDAKDAWSKNQKEKYGDETWQKELQIVRNLKPVADKLGCKQGQLALAWVLKNDNVSSAITGASKVEQITEAIGALALVPKLTDEVMKEIDEVLGNKPEAYTARF